MATPRSPLRSAKALIALLTATLLVCLAAVTPATAGEGGGSHYMPGTMGDFAMALIGPPGFYLRNDIVYFAGDINSVTLGGLIYSSASQDVWVNTVKGIYLSEDGLFGGRLGLVLSLPIVLNAHVEGVLARGPDQPWGTPSGDRSGIADMSLTTFLNWSEGEHHIAGGLTIFLPVGSYEAGRIINLGRNYWSFDPTVTYTWLDPKRGHEVSLITGLMFNTTNDATNYHSGTEWHMDITLAQHFSANFALAAVGSVLRGVSDDTGKPVDRANAVLPTLGLQPVGGFRAEYFGAGPAVFYMAPIFGKDVNFIGKYIFDVSHKYRFDSDYLVLSFAMAL
jgi:hypothetical protein